jgi:hypothetical protein
MTELMFAVIMDICSLLEGKYSLYGGNMKTQKAKATALNSIKSLFSKM